MIKELKQYYRDNPDKLDKHRMNQENYLQEDFESRKLMADVEFSKQLPTVEAVLFALRFIRDYTIDKIAKITNISTATVQRKVFKMKQDYVAFLKSKGIDYAI